MKGNLKPCPFCGHPESIPDVNEYGDCYRLCTACWASGPNRPNRKKANAAWNERAGEAPVEPQPDDRRTP